MKRLRYERPKKIESEKDIIFKDDDSMNISIEKLEENLKILKRVKDVEITELKEPYKSIFKKIIDIVHIIIDTTNYSEFYKIVEKIFNDVKDVKPKTVGAYFVGCKIQTSFDDRNNTPSSSCSILCAGSLPKPNGWKFCGNTIIWAVYTDIGFKFLELNRHDDSEIIIFVRYDNYDEFPGFTTDEKLKLRNQFSVNKLRLVSYDDTGKEYMDLIGNSVELAEIKVRTENTREITSDEKEVVTTSNSVFWILAILIFIILVFLIILIIFKMRKSSMDSEKETQPTETRSKSCRR